MTKHDSSAPKSAVPPATLRLFEGGDFLTASAEVASDPTASRILGFYAHEPGRWAALQSAHRRTFWIDLDELARVGFVEVELLGSADRATFSITIGSPFRRRGYAARALTSVILWVRANTSAIELASDTEADNQASIRTLERAGFERLDASGERVLFGLQL